MFKPRSDRNFNSAPQSVTALVASLLDVAITAPVYLAALWWQHQPIGHADLTLCFLVVALTWPCIKPIRDWLSLAAVSTLDYLITLLIILAAFGYVTRTADMFDCDSILVCALIMPVLQLLAARLGFVVLRREAADRRAWRSAVVIGAGALGPKVTRAIDSRPVQGLAFIGYFDDHTDARCMPTARATGAARCVTRAPYSRQKA